MVKISHGLNLYVIAMRELAKRGKLAEVEPEMRESLLKLTFSEYLIQGFEHPDVCYFIELFYQTLNVEVLTLEDQKHLSQRIREFLPKEAASLFLGR